MPVVLRDAEPSDDLCDFFISALAEAGRVRRRSGGDGLRPRLTRVASPAETAPQRPRFRVGPPPVVDRASMRV